MTTSYTIKAERTISKEWGELKHVTYETQNAAGERIGHKAELYDAGNAVAVLLYNAARKTVLLARQFRIATTRNGHPSGMLLEVCAGKMEDLSADETVLKEICEETGYELKEAKHIMSVFMSPGAFTERLELYVAAYTPEQKVERGGGLAEEGEDIVVQELPFTEALAMIENGQIIDAKTILLLQYAALHKLV